MPTNRARAHMAAQAGAECDSFLASCTVTWAEMVISTGSQLQWIRLDQVRPSIFQITIQREQMDNKAQVLLRVRTQDKVGMSQGWAARPRLRGR